jgi:hypothetical protein
MNKRTLLIALLFGLALATAQCASATMCGQRQATPVGCKPNPLCLCDEDGRNCRWVYEC